MYLTLWHNVSLMARVLRERGLGVDPDDAPDTDYGWAVKAFHHFFGEYPYCPKMDHHLPKSSQETARMYQTLYQAVLLNENPEERLNEICYRLEHS